MEHKGVQYQVVETVNPRGWKWTVQLAEGRTISGVSFSRGMRFSTPYVAIDRALNDAAK
jgi:hypothetical protein